VSPGAIEVAIEPPRHVPDRFFFIFFNGQRLSLKIKKRRMEKKQQQQRGVLPPLNVDR
jgi:hypothetical protein